jgi:hypothetical protein
MEKVVPLFKSFTTKFYFNFFELGMVLLDYSKLERIWTPLNHFKFWIGIKIVWPSPPAPCQGPHASLSPSPSHSSPISKPPRNPPHRLSLPRLLQKGPSAHRCPLFPPRATSSPTVPRMTPPPLPLCLLSMSVSEATAVSPVLEPPCPLIPFSRELLPPQLPIADWSVPLSPLHSLRLSEHPVVVVDHHGSPKSHHHNRTMPPQSPSPPHRQQGTTVRFRRPLHARRHPG